MHEKDINNLKLEAIDIIKRILKLAEESRNVNVKEELDKIEDDMFVLNEKLDEIKQQIELQRNYQKEFEKYM